MRRALLALAAALACGGERPAPSPAPEPAGPDAHVHADMSQERRPTGGPASPGPEAAAPARSTGPGAPVRKDSATDPHALQRRTVAVDGHPIAVHHKRPAEPWGALVLVHGRTWSSLPDFDLQVPGADISLMDNLVDEGLAVYAVDLRGYGQTPRDPGGWNTPGRAADDLVAVLQWVERDVGLRPAVLGWSLGARVAALAADRRPDVVQALILYGTPCGAPLRAPPRAPASVPPPRERRNTEASARADFITRDAVDPAVAAAFVAAAIAADPVRAEWRDLTAWRTIQFSRLRAPILVLHGDRDPSIKIDCIRERLAEAKVPSQIEVLPGADHAAHLERAAPRFVAAVVAFVRSHAQAPRNP